MVASHTHSGLLALNSVSPFSLFVILLFSLLTQVLSLSHSLFLDENLRLALFLFTSEWTTVGDWERTLEEWSGPVANIVDGRQTHAHTAQVLHGLWSLWQGVNSSPFALCSVALMRELHFEQFRCTSSTHPTTALNLFPIKLPCSTPPSLSLSLSSQTVCTSLLMIVCHTCPPRITPSPAVPKLSSLRHKMNVRKYGHWKASNFYALMTSMVREKKIFLYIIFSLTLQKRFLGKCEVLLHLFRVWTIWKQCLRLGNTLAISLTELFCELYHFQ